MANVSLRGIEADDVTLGKDVHLGERTRIVARHVTLGDAVSIGDDVTISCDELSVGAETRFADRARLIAPRITIGERSRIGSALSIEVNDRFVVGRLADVGQSVRVIAHAFVAGDHLWLTDFVRIGGGGARGPGSQLTMGDRCAVMDNCFINLSEAVSIGDDTALSNGVTVLTHSLWQPLLEGGTAQFAPVRIGSRCILYVNAVVAPGTTIGNDVTVAAGALVMQDVPDACTAVGNPARVMRSTPPVPRVLSEERQDQIVRDILRAWVDSLPTKGVTATFAAEHDRVTAAYGAAIEVVHYTARSGVATMPNDATITMAFGDRPAESMARCHVDLLSRRITGRTSAIAEDLRDFLRRRTIRIYTDDAFRPLPPAAIDRLRRQLRVSR
jgi:acetyltransferase-like isoleucine patch superfamily enzyme